MKKLFILFLIIFISSCDWDKLLENDKKTDSDDVNIIKKAWNQYLDKAIKLHYTNTHAS